MRAISVNYRFVGKILIKITLEIPKFALIKELLDQRRTISVNFKLNGGK